MRMQRCPAWPRGGGVSGTPVFVVLGSLALLTGIGSSIMAGHDNCRYDSYSSQIERSWRPVWRAAGMTFVFQNAGIGGACGDNHKNGVFCLAQNISPDADVIHYEWSNYEHGDAAAEHESLIRWAQLLPKRPPVHIFNTGAAPRTTALHTGPATVEYDYPLDARLARRYAQYGFNDHYMRSGFVNGGHDYEAEKSREVDPFDRFGWGFVGDGYHNVTRYGELERDEARRSSLGVVMRNWHPGPLGFQLTADAFTYVYTQAMLKSLDLVEQDMAEGNDPRETWATAQLRLSLEDDLPPPKFCDPEYCIVDEAPSCLNYEAPIYGRAGVRVVAPDEGPALRQGESRNWTVWHKPHDGWLAVGKQDTATFQSRADKDICPHLDQCGGIASTERAGDTVVFELSNMTVGLVVVCGCCGKTVGKSMFMDNADIEISYDSVPIPRDTWDLWPNEKCVRVRKRFPNTEGKAEPAERSQLSVKLLNDLRGQMKISHVITL